MAQPENRRPPGGAGGHPIGDLLAGDLLNHNNGHEPAAEIYAQAANVLLHLLHLRAGDARSRLVSLPAEVFPELN